jgi:succinate dehydrogenase / fumarate reductase membrane anchor subunit
VVKRVVVGAHYGVRDWLAQRVSAVAMAVYTLVFVAVLLAGGPFTFASWKALFAGGWMRSATFVFVASVLVHAWVGVREILMDYAKPAGLRFALEAAIVLVLIGYAGWALQILWRA